MDQINTLNYQYTVREMVKPIASPITAHMPNADNGYAF